MWIPDDQLPPISFGCRGFVTHEGEVIGWSIVSGDHNAYHAEHGTTDADFKTRWRKWSARSSTEVDGILNPAEAVRLGVWIERNADNVIGMPRGT